MRRWAFLLLWITAPASAQDMPLSQILPPDSTWTVSKDDPLKPAEKPPAVPSAHLKRPSGTTIWPDGGTRVIGDADDRYLWAFRIAEDGSLVDGQPYYRCQVPLGEEKSEVTDMAMDPIGRLYAATPLGVQVFDTQGRLSGVILKPNEGSLTAVRINTEVNPPILSIMCGGKRYDRSLLASGVLPNRRR